MVTANPVPALSAAAPDPSQGPPGCSHSCPHPGLSSTSTLGRGVVSPQEHRGPCPVATAVNPPAPPYGSPGPAHCQAATLGAASMLFDSSCPWKAPPSLWASARPSGAVPVTQRGQQWAGVTESQGRGWSRGRRKGEWAQIQDHVPRRSLQEPGTWHSALVQAEDGGRRPCG